ncbi:hypothetical protein NPIL_602211 [Nephila pilipes]|uniref:Uncharacterized protein n=1 Tax=Nephila pilipes TaxID=299642 RepID=A0A8X6NGW0_NEPPI|nr:hypothetical protein NPIL_602211 [Nephila pilipes]
MTLNPFHKTIQSVSSLNVVKERNPEKWVNVPNDQSRAMFLSSHSTHSPIFLRERAFNRHTPRVWDTCTKDRRCCSVTCVPINNPRGRHVHTWWCTPTASFAGRWDNGLPIGRRKEASRSRTRKPSPFEQRTPTDPRAGFHVRS